MLTQSSKKTLKNNALVVVSDMTAKEALDMHSRVKSKGHGAISEFVENDTPYDSYSEYYVELKKKGVVPFKRRKTTKLVLQPQQRVDSPANRAINILKDHLNSLDTKSRMFLCSIVSYNNQSLTFKQERWVANLEYKYLTDAPRKYGTK